jgi:hypothetical protein
MKKLLIMLFIVSIATSMSMAAIKNLTLTEPSTSTSAPVATTGNLAIGTSLGYPTLKYNFNSDFSGAVGLSYSSTGGTAQTAILVKADYNLAKMGQAQPSIGAFYTTDGAATATTSFGLIYGVSTMVLPNLSLGADAIVLTQATRAGVNATGILSGVVLSAALYL